MFQGGEEIEDLISDEEDDPVLPPEGPPAPVVDNSKEADLLNWSSSQNGSTDTAQVTSDMNLLDINVSGGMKKDLSNFDLLSGFNESDSAPKVTPAANSGEANRTQENLFDPFSTSSADPQVLDGPAASENLLGQFSAPQPQQQANTFGQFGVPVSWNKCV